MAGGSAVFVTRVIAIVDDDASVLRALARLLRAAGFVVKTFASGEELLGCDDLLAIDCLLLDIQLGHLTGFDVRDRLAARRVPMPIVFITARDDLAMGARACLRKPFDEDELLAAIHAAVGRGAP